MHMKDNKKTRKLFLSFLTLAGVSAVSFAPIAAPAVTFAEEQSAAEDNESFSGTETDEGIMSEEGSSPDTDLLSEEEMTDTSEYTDPGTVTDSDDQKGFSGTGAVYNVYNSNSVNASGNGWVYENGAYYYYKDGAGYTGWKWMTSAEGEKYPHWSYFGENGRLRTGWVHMGSGTSNPDGNKGAHWSYFGDNGWLRTGWVHMGKGTANADGNSSAHWSYFGDNGWLRTGWQQFGKGTSNPDGNSKVHWSYFGDNGWLRTGWVQLGKGTADPDGNSTAHWSYFGTNGWLRTEWVQFGAGTSEPDGGSAKHWSYFGPNGWLRTGWQDMGAGTSNPDGNSKKHKSYFGSNGWMRTGQQYIDGNTYSFDSKGWLIEQDQAMLSKAQYYSSSTGYLILVDRAKCKTAIFKGSYGNWSYDKYWSCCVGKPSTPTITGIYYLGYKQLYFDPEDGGRCWYKSQIYGSYLFHSVIYYRDSGPYDILDGTMGEQVSHGCVRLDIQNAKYIYDSVPSGTTVVIYN